MWFFRFRVVLEGSVSFFLRSLPALFWSPFSVLFWVRRHLSGLRASLPYQRRQNARIRNGFILSLHSGGVGIGCIKANRWRRTESTEKEDQCSTVTAEKTGDPSGGSVRGGGLFFFLFRLIQPVAWESGRPAPDGAGRNGTKFDPWSIAFHRNHPNSPMIFPKSIRISPASLLSSVFFVYVYAVNVNFYWFFHGNML